MAKRLVRLRGDPEDIQALRLVGAAEWQIVEEDGLFYLQSSTFNDLQDDGRVLDTARELLQTVGTAAAVFCSGYRPVAANRPFASSTSCGPASPSAQERPQYACSPCSSVWRARTQSPSMPSAMSV